MKLIIFSEDSKTKQRLIEAVRAVDPDGDPDIHDSPEPFFERLRQPALSQTIAIMYVMHRHTLDLLMNERKIIRDIKTIIILSDDQSETISAAHLFHPRFVIFTEDISEKLPMVLAKMNDNMTSSG